MYNDWLRNCITVDVEQWLCRRSRYVRPILLCRCTAEDHTIGLRRQFARVLQSLIGKG